MKNNYSIAERSRIVEQHIDAQLQYELLSCKDSRRRYGFTGAPRDLRGAVISLDDCRELAAA